MTTHGITDLDRLIKNMEPVLHPDIFVFTTFSDSKDLSAFDPIMMFREQEGITLIVTQAMAEAHKVDFEFPSRMITLNIHSALDAVGFMARVASHLAALNMGVNPVAGFYHDHLFIPAERTDDAMLALHEMTQI